MIDYDMIKLDKYFIDDIESSFRKREIMKCMSNITKENKTIMVIEGVESYAQVEMIRTFDNDTMYIQGYYYSKPVPLDKVITLKIKSEILNNKSKNSVIKGWFKEPMVYFHVQKRTINEQKKSKNVGNCVIFFGSDVRLLICSRISCPIKIPSKLRRDFNWTWYC